jgi:hypothetical protein
MHSTRPERIRSHTMRSAEQHTHTALLALLWLCVCCLAGRRHMLPPSSYAPPLSSACIRLTYNVWCGDNDPADSCLLASIARRSAAALWLLILSRRSRPHSFPAPRSLRAHSMHTRNTGREYGNDGAPFRLQPPSPDRKRKALEAQRASLHSSHRLLNNPSTDS